MSTFPSHFLQLLFLFTLVMLTFFSLLSSVSQMKQSVPTSGPLLLLELIFLHFIDWIAVFSLLMSQFRCHLSENYPETFMLKEEALQMYSHLLTSI